MLLLLQQKLSKIDQHEEQKLQNLPRCPKTFDIDSGTEQKLQIKKKVAQPYEQGCGSASGSGVLGQPLPHSWVG